ncbi:hypothetical protein AJ80_02668 [Polytolypa hystricis UAMH7299]|uniref:Uncharacterized protein n=1 Tax=Polytolypa hystricis (strain UAMH7299) TaxID=1447883 RepID=A0A2B7YQW2_POLH7|nr:hypothetical protein AJ80_02668 [Polytolypa hystricis UAMH7299]
MTIELRGFWVMIGYASIGKSWVGAKGGTCKVSEPKTLRLFDPDDPTTLSKSWLLQMEVFLFDSGAALEFLKQVS